MSNHQGFASRNGPQENQRTGILQLTKHAWRFISALCLTVLIIPIGVSVAEEPRTGAWSGGAAVGFFGQHTGWDRICNEYTR